MTPYQSTAPAGHDSFAHLLHAEWTKFRTVRGLVTAAIVAALVTILLGVYGGARSQNGCVNGPCHPFIATGPGGEAVTDAFYFVHRPLTTDGSITTEMTSLTGVIETGQTPQGPAQTAPGLQAWSKAGLIITAGSGQGSAYAAVMVTGSQGTRMQWNYTGDTAGLAGTRVRGIAALAAPESAPVTSSPATTQLTARTGPRSAPSPCPGWRRRCRPGCSPPPRSPRRREASRSPADRRATTRPTPPPPSTASACRARWPASAWVGTNVNGGSNSQYPTGTESGYHQADGTFTVTGTGDIAPGAAGGTPMNYELGGRVPRAHRAGRGGRACSSPPSTGGE